jgi:DNA modification methylase
MLSVAEFENKILLGNVYEVLREFPDECIDCVISSPPYYRVRKYSPEAEVMESGGKKCELGYERTVNEFVDNLLKLFVEIKRILKPTGTVFWNMGDSYVNGRLVFAPERFAIRASDEQGWYVRNMIIWNKPLRPSPIRDRFANRYEYIIFMTKSPKYYFDLRNARLLSRKYILPFRVGGAHGGRNKDEYGWRFLGYKGFDDKWYIDPSGPMRYLIREDTVLDSELMHNLVKNVSGDRNDTDKVNGVKNSGDGDKLNGSCNVEHDPETLEYLCELLEWLKTSFRQISDYLRTRLTEKDISVLDNKFGVEWRRWLSSNLEEAFFPKWAEWVELKSALGWGATEIDDVVKALSETDLGMGRNVGDVLSFDVNKEQLSHTAVYPTDMIVFFLKVGCPFEVCSKCGKPKMLQFTPIDKFKKSITFRRLYRCGMEAMCNCGVDFIPGIVLDPFMGSGTTAVAAQQLGLRWTGVEIVKRFKEEAEQRLAGVHKLLFPELRASR